MIQGVTSFFQTLEVPITITGVVLGFLLKTGYDIVTSRVRRRRRNLRETIQWYKDLRSISRRIALTCRVTSRVTEMFDVEEGEMDSNGRVEPEDEVWIHDTLEEYQENGLEKHLSQMEMLHEELVSHIATSDIDVPDDVHSELEFLVFHTFFATASRLEPSLQEEIPAEKRAEDLIESCDEKIEMLESQLPVWRFVLNSIIGRGSA